MSQLELMKLNYRKQQISLSKLAMEVRLTEIEEEKARILNVIPIYDKEISEIEDSIKVLENGEV